MGVQAKKEDKDRDEDRFMSSNVNMDQQSEDDSRNRSQWAVVNQLYWGTEGEESVRHKVSTRGSANVSLA